MNGLYCRRDQCLSLLYRYYSSLAHYLQSNTLEQEGGAVVQQAQQQSQVQQTQQVQVPGQTGGGVTEVIEAVSDKGTVGVGGDGSSGDGEHSRAVYAEDFVVLHTVRSSGEMMADGSKSGKYGKSGHRRGESMGSSSSSSPRGSTGGATNNSGGRGWHQRSQSSGSVTPTGSYGGDSSGGERGTGGSTGRTQTSGAFESHSLRHSPHTGSLKTYTDAKLFEAQRQKQQQQRRIQQLAQANAHGNAACDHAVMRYINYYT